MVTLPKNQSYTVTVNEQDERLEPTADPTLLGRGTPAIQTITYRPIPDPSARMVSIQTGEIDAAGNPRSLVPTLRDSADSTIPPRSLAFVSPTTRSTFAAPIAR